MSNEVFANGNEIACKSGDGKVIAAFPDVCLSPPSPPAGPVPVPYPNTSFSKDMKKGSKTVKINSKDVMLKDKSFYKTSPLGDEAATKSLGAGVISHVITGKTYFVAWSMDVKFEGKNVDRHIDFTTSNHASPMANESVTIPNTESYSPVQDSAQVEGKHKCECCGGDAHSKAQAEGKYMSEDEFYDTANNPANAAFLVRVRKKCKHLLPPEGKKPMGCNKYYVTTRLEKQRITSDWEDHNSSNYRNFAGVPKGTDIAHRVPKAAGGCPAGQGNLAPIGNKCKKKLEKQLGDLQENRIKKLRKAKGIQ